MTNDEESKQLLSIMFKALLYLVAAISAGPALVIATIAIAFVFVRAMG